jgi:N-acetyl-alpha-D-glucosaminyl L-malate synthase BshA
MVHASNFRPVKRVADVIKVFAKVQKQIPAKLLLIGTGVGIEDTRAAVQEYELEDHVIFVGKQSNIDELIASSDVFLLPSSQESFGLVALEAMAYGVPVVATNVGGLPEVIENGDTGFLVGVGDIDAMAAKAIEIMSNPERAKQMGARGRQRAREAFTVERILPQYEAFYQQALLSVSSI